MNDLIIFVKNEYLITVYNIINIIINIIDYDDDMIIIINWNTDQYSYDNDYNNISIVININIIIHIIYSNIHYT